MADEKQIRKERQFAEKLKRNPRFTHVIHRKVPGSRRIYFEYGGRSWYLTVSKDPMDLMIKTSYGVGQVTIFEEFPSLKLFEDVLQNA